MSHRPVSAAFPFQSRTLDVKGSRIHYIDEGSGDPILFLHGNPTSSYIWRNIVPHLSGHARCIAPDLIGMGQSDRPDIDYGFADAYAYLEAFIEQLGLENVTLVVQDWGSGLGFHYANLHRENIKGIAFMEAMYRMVDWEAAPAAIKFGLIMMRSRLTSFLMLGVANLFVKNFISDWTVRELSAEEREVYERPYPTLASRKPVRVFPADVPVRGKPAHSAEAVVSYFEWLQETPIPKLCFHATPGMLIRPDDARWISENFPNTRMVDLGEGIHFLQEDHPDVIGEELAKWYAELR